ncbi:P-loop containing nucleoside triphosphate hydrolase protein [Lentithecium fluviatile CBS 122367]|uniref:P-loop containing nucleoside triphosphate hydrolase protein n=1 Tax=Lentithecium fluviatile CBS 122367 TaxID=1168545 RepID=A0A6G1JFC5_9PLEO|nr:P-loop containing nucleoside triphosphate hydrolase protein [Lentithecium fluviatile CBS 122367]
MASRTLVVAISPQAKASYLALASIGRRAFSASTPQSSQYRRSDFSGQGFTSFYDPDELRGPLADVSTSGVSRITPRMLKEHLDQFVVGQDHAKKVLSVAVYDHYKRLRELQRQEDEQASQEEKAARQAMAHRHPVEEDEFPGQQSTMHVYPSHAPPLPAPPPLQDTSSLQFEKSNVLMLGPTGVGKTLIAKTLARVLDVPFSMSDCTPFTQSGYIGEDAESCVQRLLAAANYDVEAAERGIIVLDEIDKIAGVKMAHGKDVGGEGVQQSLLKIIEGTTLQLQAKAERGGSSKAPGVSGSSSFSSSNPLDGSRSPSSGAGPVNPGKSEVFNVRTDNILFVCTGAFVGLEKIILNRKAKGGLGFGARIRAASSGSGKHDTTLSDEDVVAFRKDLPIYTPSEPEPPTAYGVRQAKRREEEYNVLHYVEPADLQKYGMIPELVGRIAKTCAVSALDEEALVRVLTEPKNSLIRQEAALFQADGIEIRFTSGALREIAKKANVMGTGARGLKAVVERLLLDSKFDAPGSTVKHILITQEVAQLKCAPLHFHRGQSQAFETTHKQQEDDWQEVIRAREEDASSIHSFEEYRKAGAAGY